MPVFQKCMAIKATTTVTLPADWDPANNGVWGFSAGGNGDDAAFACISIIHIPYAGSGGGGGDFASVLNFGGTAGGPLICTVGVAGGRAYGVGPGTNRTIVDTGAGHAIDLTSGQSASPSGACVNSGGIQGLGATGNNDGGFGNSGFNFQNGGGGGNLYFGVNNAGAPGDWADAIAATPNVWFNPAGTGLDWNTVAAAFPGGGVAQTYGGGGLGGRSNGAPTINGAVGFYPGGGGGGGASAGNPPNGVGAVGADGLILLYYNPLAAAGGENQIYLLGC
jgi:hypothetical protein